MRKLSFLAIALVVGVLTLMILPVPFIVAAAVGLGVATIAAFAAPFVHVRATATGSSETAPAATSLFAVQVLTALATVRPMFRLFASIKTVAEKQWINLAAQKRAAQTWMQQGVPNYGLRTADLPGF